MLAWIDLEMTGLDPSTEVIVEIAVLLTDDDLEIVAEGPDVVVFQPAEKMAAMADVVQRMHQSSGLTVAVAASTTSLEDAGRQVLDFLRQHIPQPGTVPAVRQLHRHRPALPGRLPARPRQASSTTGRSTCRR